uniref:Putative secreted peptide n=1 Tax=Anopheles braziliensis TaxID=58242 RepID=A0A2M3ZQQ9_9DIPT
MTTGGLLLLLLLLAGAKLPGRCVPVQVVVFLVTTRVKFIRDRFGADDDARRNLQRFPVALVASITTLDGRAQEFGHLRERCKPWPWVSDRGCVQRSEENGTGW